VAVLCSLCRCIYCLSLHHLLSVRPHGTVRRPSLLTNSNQCYIVHGFFSYSIGHCQHSRALCYSYCNGCPMTWSSHAQWFLFIQERTVSLTKITHYHISVLFNDVSHWHFIPLTMDEWMNEWVLGIDGKLGLLQWKAEVLEEKPVAMLICPPPVRCGLIWHLPQSFYKYLVHIYIILFKEHYSNDTEIYVHQWMCYIRGQMCTVKSNRVTKVFYCRTKRTETVHQVQDFLTLADGTDRLTQNVGKELPLYAV